MSEKLQLLNIGCGQHFHRQWTNVDFVSVDPAVQQCDLRKGLPEPSDQFDMVYHSHVLEHFAPEEGQKMLAECFRVLKPGGILRIVVPDLEQIATLYLENLHRAWEGESSAADRYQWMKLELLDQMTRHQSGGSMGPFMVQSSGAIADFLDERLGREVTYAKATMDSSSKVTDAKSKPHASNKPGRKSWSDRFKQKVLKWLIGKDGIRQLEIGRFRDSGEVHRWMYDRYSLRALCTELGFEGFVIRSASESYLRNFDAYQLDCCQGRIRKPDSLFVECRKPKVAVALRDVA